MLKLDNINVTLNQGTNIERNILKDLSFEVSEGEFIIILGGNGAGKSTLFNVISGFMQPVSGRILIDKENVTFKKHIQRAPFIAKVMQDPKVGTMENMTIEENMSFAYKRGQKRLLAQHLTSKRRAFYREKLAILGMGLENRLEELVVHLSGGQRQALSLIMAIMADSKILLLDEMTAALDPKMAEKVMHIANTIVTEEKRTTLMITHNLVHALEYGDRILIVGDGKIQKEFSANDKKQMNVQELAKEFNHV
jgi:putative tryptophan/tyrosine transport system ATP-binding protein